MSDAWGWTGDQGSGRKANSSVRRTRIIIIAIAVLLGIALYHRGTINRFTFIYFAMLVPSVVLHEVSHGYVANFFGDDTAKRAGRLTLNPVTHLDLLGSLVLPAMLILSVGTGIGFAKPVPVTISRLRNPRADSFYVAIAGPATNFLLFLIAAIAWRILNPNIVNSDLVIYRANLSPIGLQFLYAFGLVNLLLMIFNLIPIPPLDGSAIVERLLPTSLLPGYLKLRPYGMVIVLVFAFFIWRAAVVQTWLFNFENHMWSVFGAMKI